MSGSSHFVPGKILWLPKISDISTYAELNANSTIPKKCFGHSVLVLSSAAERNTDCVTILILTSFDNGTNIETKIKYRKHKPSDYVPIHPAVAFVSGPPSLRLCASEQFTRHIWAAPREPQRCPKAWLQETWPQVWKGRAKERRIEQRSLQELALYAVQTGYNRPVYSDFLEAHAAPAPAQALAPIPIPATERSPLLPARSVSVDMGENFSASWAHMNRVRQTDERNSPFASTPTCQPLGRSVSASQWYIASQRGPILPQTNPMYPGTQPRSVARVAGPSPHKERSSTGEAFFRVLLGFVMLGLLGGVVWGVYMAVFWLFSVFRNAPTDLIGTVGPMGRWIARVAEDVGQWLFEALKALGIWLRGSLKGSHV